MEKSINISTIQTELVWESRDENLAHFEKLFKQIPKESDIVVMPEMFSTGFSMSPEKLAEKVDGVTVQWMKSQAKKLEKVIVGSVIIEDQDQFFNRLFWVNPNGEMQSYDKKHCFRYADEHLHYTAGEQELIVNYKGWNFACYICYDLRFPVWSRNTNLKYDAAIYIANWPERRSEHWTSLLKARAIENQAYVVGVNRIGDDGNRISHSGDTAVYNEVGKRISVTKPGMESVETITLSKENLNTYREKFPAWKDADEFKF